MGSPSGPSSWVSSFAFVARTGDAFATLGTSGAVLVGPSLTGVAGRRLAGGMSGGPYWRDCLGAGGELGCTAEFIEAAYAERAQGSEVRFGQLISEARRAVRAIAEQAQADGLWIHWGRKVLELRPPVLASRQRVPSWTLRLRRSNSKI